MGAPTFDEIKTQWQNLIDVYETARNHIDATMVNSGGKLDTLVQSLEGTYTPESLSALANRIQSLYSTIIDPGVVLDGLTPLIFEMAARIESDATADQGFGAGASDVQSLFQAIYNYFIEKSYTVQSRNITYDTTPTHGASNNGNGGSDGTNPVLARITVDDENHSLEACTVERKIFRCAVDQNSGTDEHAEVFEVLGAPASIDSTLRASFGSGEASRTLLTSLHAGSGDGGSLLQNSSFSTFSASGSPKFAGWTESAGGDKLAQDTTNYYRSHPGASTDASLKITNDGTTVTIKQTLDAMQIAALDPDVPYFLRIMIEGATGSASGGTVTLRMGSVSKSQTVAGLGANWKELMIDADVDGWLKTFNEDPFDVEIELSGGSSGTILIDDAILAPYTLIDGTYYAIRINDEIAVNNHPAPWLKDDTLTITDTGGAPTTGKIQWWNWIAGLGHLPSTTGSATFDDP